MKIRIKGNSIRLRLTQSEVEQFGATKEVKEKIMFGTALQQHLIYKLAQKPAALPITVTFMDNEITIYIAEDMAEEWVTTDRVSLGNQMNIGNGQRLHILVEKDFKCLVERPNEDDSDAFPNPLA